MLSCLFLFSLSSHLTLTLTLTLIPTVLAGEFKLLFFAHHFFIFAAG